jgi:hypothetical protein
MHDVDPAFGVETGDWTGYKFFTFGDPRAVEVSPDGVTLLALGGSSNPLSYGYVLSTPFDITTAGAPVTRFTNTGQLDWYWAQDGLTVWIYSSSNPTNSIRELDVAVAFDVSSINLTAVKTKLLTADTGSINSFTFSDDGLVLYMIVSTGSPGSIASYELSTPFDIDTAGSFTIGVEIGDPSRMSIPRGLYWRPTDGALFVNGDQGVGNQRVKFFCPTDAVKITDFSAASYSGDIGASAIDPNGVFVDASGTRAFIVNGSPGNDVDSYSMSVPFDLTTLSAVIASETIVTSPIGVFLKPDGTKIFFTTFSSNVGVQEFPLSVAWDITTMGAMTLLSTAGDGATIPFGLHFSSDGLNVYTSDNGGNLYQWSLASAWDVSSPTFIGSFDFTNEVAATKGQDLSLSNDGTKLYLPDLNIGTDSEVFEYTLSKPFNITTAFFSGRTLTLTGRIGMSGFHMLDANDRFYAAYNGDAGGADPEALEEFTI